MSLRPFFRSSIRRYTNLEDSLSKEEREYQDHIDNCGRYLAYCAVGIIGVATMIGLGYVIQGYSQAPTSAIRGAITP